MMHLLQQQVLFISKVEEEDGMQETHHETERRSATRGATTTAMIGAVFMVNRERVRLQNKSQMKFVSTCQINFGTANMCITNTNHLNVFMMHKHKINFGNAPISTKKGGMVHSVGNS